MNTHQRNLAVQRQLGKKTDKIRAIEQDNSSTRSRVKNIEDANHSHGIRADKHGADIRSLLSRVNVLEADNVTLKKRIQNLEKETPI